MSKDIYKVETFIDKNGRNISKIVNIENNSFEYYGNAIVEIDESKVPVQFPLENSSLSIQECFEKFDEILTNFLKNYFKKTNEENLQTASVEPKIISPS